jgi:medium-chain acyl-[acyl-carrier-protein] hydrolase
MGKSYSANPWVVRNRDRVDARLRLFCFPHAGAGSAIYHGWLRAFSPTIDVCAIELPGRFVRQADPVPEFIPELIAALDTALEPYLDLPFALFGYSLGALTAFEWSRSLRRRLGREPQTLIVAASGAPHLPARYEAISQLPAHDFLRAIETRFGPIDPALRAHPDMVALVTDILRRDFRMLEHYRHVSAPPLDCPITAIGGTRDRGVPRERLAAWQTHSTRPLRIEMFEGEHFFLRTCGRELASLVGELASDAVPAAGVNDAAQ